MGSLATFSTKYQSSPRRSERAIGWSHVKFMPADELHQSAASNPGHAAGYRCMSGSRVDLA